MTKLALASVLALTAASGVARADLPPVNGSPNAEATGNRVAGETDERKTGEHEIEGEKPEPADPTTHFNFFGIHYNGKDEYGGTFGDGEEIGKDGKVYEEEPMSAPFILAFVNFALLLILLAKYGGPLARKTAEDRHDLIKTALEDAAKLRDQARVKLADYEKRIAGLDTEIKSLVDGIRADADADKARILAAADAQAAQMKRDAETRIAAEILLARAQLTKEITAAATKATALLVQKNLTPTDQERLVGAFIGGMAKEQV
jgi:F-type H+-transporting ATPase subunit b